MSSSSRRKASGLSQSLPPPATKPAASSEEEVLDGASATADVEYSDNDALGLLGNNRRSTVRMKRFFYDYYDEKQAQAWIRPYWLGMGLFLILFSFWILDSLKDNVLGMLTHGNLEEHQPPAKLFSVFATLALVLLVEYVSQERQHQHEEQRLSDEDVMSGEGNWDTIQFHSDSPRDEDEGRVQQTDGVTSSIFSSIGVPYCIVFGCMAYVLQFNASVGSSRESGNHWDDSSSTAWTFVGYAFYAAIESFGSIAVATFWSYANSTLSLEEAESYYGTIIAIAQLGAILGSTMVTTHVWSTITLIIVACLVILLHIVMMQTYNTKFPPSSSSSNTEESAAASTNQQASSSAASGVHLILKHNYVLLILGVSCLYEISLTCLNYQMTLLGWDKFEGEEVTKLSFAQFMGHYGQMVNLSSLLLSSLLFPLLIKRVGLRWLLRGFPTLLLLVNVMAFGILPGNLAVLFFSLAFLKAMTYSIHDPAKELLYLPTSNAIKFKSKFWIDVVGARIAKAVGSSINNFAGSVDRSIRISSTPSLLTALGLWIVCYRVGIMFEDLVATKTVVGVNDPLSNKEEQRQLLYETPEEDGYIHDAGPIDSEDDGSAMFADPLGKI